MHMKGKRLCGNIRSLIIHVEPIHLFIYLFIYVATRTHTHTRTHTQAQKRVHTHTHTRTPFIVRLTVSNRTHTHHHHIHTHTHTHKHTHTHTHMWYRQVSFAKQSHRNLSLLRKKTRQLDTASLFQKETRQWVSFPKRDLTI